MAGIDASHRIQLISNITKEVDPHQSDQRTGFGDLPHEVRDRILWAACGQDGHGNRCSGASPLADCTRTAAALVLVCRDLHHQMLPLLYAIVRLSRPSALATFNRTLTARPALGRLVKRLHIGPEEALPQDWWPLQISRNPNVAGQLRVNLFDPRDEVASKRFRHSESLPTKPSSKQDLWSAAGAAVELGAEDLDLARSSPGFSWMGRHIGSDAWHVRVWELQAAMELWCLDVCSREAGGTETPFPRLVVGASRVSPPSLTGQKVVHVTRSQLYERMSRKGAPTDHFGHPLLFALSGLRWHARLPETEEDSSLRWNTPEDRLHGGGSSRRELDSWEDISDAFAWPDSRPSEEGDDVDVEWPPLSLCDPLDPDIPSTATIGGNTALARTVLSLTPAVHTLSLTGFLERALVGFRAPCHQDLRFVNLGPPPRGWAAELHLEHSTLRGVGRLRICGGPLRQSELDAIAGKRGALVSLQELQWIPTTECWGGWSYKIANTVNALFALNKVAKRSASSEHLGEQSQRRKKCKCSYEDEAVSSRDREDEDEQQALDSSTEHARSLSIHTTLARSEREGVLRRAPSEQVATAWDHGTRVAGHPHRLKICSYYFGDLTNSRRLEMASRMMFEEGRLRWEME